MQQPRFAGRIKTWNADRGFGFIEPVGGGQEIFVHISARPTSLRRPKIGDSLTFEIELDRDGKKRASKVSGATTRRHGRRRPDAPAPWTLTSTMALVCFVGIYAGLSLTKGVSIWFAVGYAGLSIICLLAYAFDKSAAVAGRWRSSEQSLILLGLVGGWPGGLFAQHLLRHKSSKASFQVAFWISVVVNVAAFVFFHVYTWPEPA